MGKYKYIKGFSSWMIYDDRGRWTSSRSLETTAQIVVMDANGDHVPEEMRKNAEIRAELWSVCDELDSDRRKLRRWIRQIEDERCTKRDR